MQVWRQRIQRVPPLIVILLLTVGIFDARAQEPGSTIRFADSPFPPYTIGEEGDHDAQGIGPEIVREACRRMGVECTIELHPWQRVLRMLQTGDADAVPAVMEAPERDWYLTLTEPLVHTREIIFYNVTECPGFTWHEYSDLRGLRIGLVDGYAYGAEFRDAVTSYGLEIDYSGSTEENLRKLIAGRVDLVVEEEIVAEYLLRRLPGGSVVAGSTHTVTAYDFHIAFSRFSPASELVDAFSEVIRQMQQDGTIEAIVAAFVE